MISEDFWWVGQALTFSPLKTMKYSLLLSDYVLVTKPAFNSGHVLNKGCQIMTLTDEGGVSLNCLGYKDTSCFLYLKICTPNHFNFFEIRVCFVTKIYI